WHHVPAPRQVREARMAQRKQGGHRPQGRRPPSPAVLQDHRRRRGRSPPPARRAEQALQPARRGAAPAQHRGKHPVIRLRLGLLILVGTALLVNEVSGWLGLIPRGILRLVAMRLPADLRQAIYKEEWLPELLRELRDAEGRPITRLVVGIKY